LIKRPRIAAFFVGRFVVQWPQSVERAMAQPAPQSTDSQLLNLKLPPHSIDAEQSVLGGLLIDNTAFDRIGDVVSDSDFYRDDHRRIFRHISRLVERASLPTW